MTIARPILVATDLSAPSRHAVERAFRLAAAGGQLHLLHVLELDALDSLREMLGGDVSGVRATLENEARARLAQLADEAQRHHGLAVQTRVAVGNPLAVIAQAADDLDAGLVVLGARGESFLRHALLGATAMRLVRKSVRRPVLVVKQPPHEAYRRALLAVDFSPASPAAVGETLRVAPGADLTLLHAFELPYEGKLNFAGVDEQVIRRYVAQESEARRKRLYALADAAGLSAPDYAARIQHGDPAQQIIAMEQEIEADLIVVGKHGTHVAEELLLGSVTKHVLAESQGDVLILCDARAAPERLP